VRAFKNAAKALKGFTIKKEGAEGVEKDSPLSIQERLKKAARETAERREKLARAAGEKKDEHEEKEVYFVNAAIAVGEDEAESFMDEGYWLVEVDLPNEGKFYCMLETDEQREERIFVWHQIVKTLTKGKRGLAKELWKHIPIGDCFSLVKFIRDRFGRDRYSEQSTKWHATLDSLSTKNKGFDIFCAEIKKILMDAKTVGIAYDRVNMRNKVRDAIERGGNEAWQAEWKDAIKQEAREKAREPASFREWAVEELLEAMRAGVMVEKGGAGQSDGDRLRKEVEELKKQIKKFSASPAKSAEKTGNLLTVCSKFQDDKCKTAGCKFSHTKLSQDDKTKLRETLKKRWEERAAKGGAGPASQAGPAAASIGSCYKCGEAGHMAIACKKSEVTCFKCGKDGHKAAACSVKTPNKRAVKKTMLVDLLQEQDFEELLQEAKLMAKVQVRAEESE